MFRRATDCLIRGNKSSPATPENPTGKIHVVNLTFSVRRSTRFRGFYHVSVRGLILSIGFKEGKRQNAFALQD